VRSYGVRRAVRWGDGEATSGARSDASKGRDADCKLHGKGDDGRGGGEGKGRLLGVIGIPEAEKKGWRKARPSYLHAFPSSRAIASWLAYPSCVDQLKPSPVKPSSQTLGTLPHIIFSLRPATY
jgi:hypothetical protein